MSYDTPRISRKQRPSRTSGTGILYIYFFLNRPAVLHALFDLLSFRIPGLLHRSERQKVVSNPHEKCRLQPGDPDLRIRYDTGMGTVR